MIILLTMAMCDQQLTKCHWADKGLATLCSPQVSLTMLTIHLPAWWTWPDLCQCSISLVNDAQQVTISFPGWWTMATSWSAWADAAQQVTIDCQADKHWPYFGQCGFSLTSEWQLESELFASLTEHLGLDTGNDNTSTRTWANLQW